MEVSFTDIEDLVVAKSFAIVDHRGMFSRLFCDKILAKCFGPRNIKQINLSRTLKAGAIRGLHYQVPPYAEMKLIRCVKGRVWDVAVDIRQGSKTFLKYHSQELSEENGLMLIIPEGFAHGFQVMEANSELLYLHTAPYNKESERGLYYNDPKLGIDWPLQFTEVSQKDSSNKLITNDFMGIDI